MKLVDVNVLLYAHRRDALDHPTYRIWLEDLVNGEQAFGMAELVLSSFVRIATHRRVFDPPSTPEEAFAFAASLLNQPNCVLVKPGAQHWPIFHRLCIDADARGGLVTDAYLAALAIESGCEWITTDRDFARFPGLTWRHPLVH